MELSTVTKQKTACCPHCGGVNFYVHEWSYSKAFTDDENPNEIIVHSARESGIDLIECCNEKCPGSENGNLANITDLQYQEGVEFNFQ